MWWSSLISDLYELRGVLVILNFDCAEQKFVRIMVLEGSK
jgi:hypothetical protein